MECGRDTAEEQGWQNAECGEETGEYECRMDLHDEFYVVCTLSVLLMNVTVCRVSRTGEMER